MPLDLVIQPPAGISPSPASESVRTRGEPGGDGLQFYRDERISREMERLREELTVIQKTIRETGDREIRYRAGPRQGADSREMDLSRISEQVYRAITQKILVERERRGVRW